MIPIRLKKLVEQQQGEIHRENRDVVKRALSDLGVSLGTELAEFFLTYCVTTFEACDNALAWLEDVAEPTPQIASATYFIHEVWELPERFICLSDVQCEGAYLYDKDTGKVWDFELRTREDFVSGKQTARWNSFFEFMIWYLGGDCTDGY
jgi:hypothetical protein